MELWRWGDAEIVQGKPTPVNIQLVLLLWTARGVIATAKKLLGVAANGRGTTATAFVAASISSSSSGGGDGGGGNSSAASGSGATVGLRGWWDMRGSPTTRAATSSGSSRGVGAGVAANAFLRKVGYTKELLEAAGPVKDKVVVTALLQYQALRLWDDTVRQTMAAAAGAAGGGAARGLSQVAADASSGTGAEGAGAAGGGERATGKDSGTTVATASGGGGDDVSDVASGRATDQKEKQLPKRLAKLPQQGLPEAVVDQLDASAANGHHIYLRSMMCRNAGQRGWRC